MPLTRTQRRIIEEEENSIPSLKPEEVRTSDQITKHVQAIISMREEEEKQQFASKPEKTGSKTTNEEEKQQFASNPEKTGSKTTNVEEVLIKRRKPTHIVEEEEVLIKRRKPEEGKSLDAPQDKDTFIPVSSMMQKKEVKHDPPINVNTFTHAMLSNPLYLCNSCRLFLKKQQVTPSCSKW